VIWRKKIGGDGDRVRKSLSLGGGGSVEQKRNGEYIYIYIYIWSHENLARTMRWTTTRGFKKKDTIRREMERISTHGIGYGII